MSKIRGELSIQKISSRASFRVLDQNMELLAVKLEKKQNGITEVYAEKKILGSEKYTTEIK